MFSNTVPCKEETNMAIASIWWLTKLAWCDVTWKPSIVVWCILSSRTLLEDTIPYLTQQDYYGWWCGTLLQSYCTSTYTEVTVLLLWSSSNATLEYPRRYSNRVAVWVLHGNSRVTSQEQHGYSNVGTNAVTV